jgi:acyl-coenzyme A thioesterase PaaI-like protein
LRTPATKTPWLRLSDRFLVGGVQEGCKPSSAGAIAVRSLTSEAVAPEHDIRDAARNFATNMPTRETKMTDVLDDRADAAPALNESQTERMITKNLPPIDHHGEVVEAVGGDAIRVRLPYRADYMGAEPWQDGGGQVFSGPMVMGFADTAMYCCVMAAMGENVIPVMVNFSITFLRPARAADLLANARIVRRGTRLHYLECWLTSDGEAEPCAHITSTYRVARRP